MAELNDWGSPVLLLGFVLLLALFGGVTALLKTRSEQATLREAIRAGQPIDASLLSRVEASPRQTREGLRTGGFVTIAVALALIGFGLVMNRATGDEQIALVMSGIALFPGLIGASLILASAGRRRAD